MPAGDKQCPIVLKKVALRESPNEIGNAKSKPGNSQFVTDKKPAPGFVKLVGPDVKTASTGIKRQNPDNLSSSSSYQAPGEVGPNTSIVYVRRKLEIDHSSTKSASVGHPKFPEVNNSSRVEVDSEQGQNNNPKAEVNSRFRIEEGSEQVQNHKPKEASPPSSVPVTVAPLATPRGAVLASHSLIKSFPGLAVSEQEIKVMPSHNSVLVSGSFLDTNRAVYQDWKDRFLRLQLFLRSCDETSQEEYIQQLRSLSPIGRSRHAVELEKRAIYLLLEEGKELHRMRVLNVLGKGSPRDQPSVATQMTSPFRDEKYVNSNLKK